MPVKISRSYKIGFPTNIREHHVYKSVWKAKKGERLDCHKDDRDEASMYDHVIGVYKIEKDSTLVYRVPRECSTLVVIC